jgi:dimethylaniline monooxygenase (N-oxide forming)
VRVADGSLEEIDAIIYATGYEIRFPFLKPKVLDIQNNDLRLYCRVVPPDHPGLYFVGFVQPLGSLPPLAELQAIWIANLLTGRSRLPGRNIMLKEIESYRRSLEKRYVDSPRHTIQVDYYPYIRQLQKETHRTR